MTRIRRAIATGNILRHLTLALGLLVFGAGTAVAAAAAPQPAAIEAALTGSGPLLLQGRALDRATFQAIYQKRDFRPIWNDDRTASFELAVTQATSQGLDPADYAVPTLPPVARELLLTDAFLRYAKALAQGRVSPQSYETDWLIPRPPLDPDKTLDAAITGNVAAVLAGLAPHNPAYERLRAALQHYRTIEQDGWRPLHITKTLRPGDSGADVAQLRARVAAAGFADAAGATNPEIYGDSLTKAVSQFQAARGLTVDGKAGRHTLAALNVPPAERVRQIRFNLERWRSLPRISAKTRIEVNAAAATVVLYVDDIPVKTMRAVVGAVKHPTPILHALMTRVVFNPPWIVPTSIIKNEILPRLRRDPGYLDRFGYVYADIRGMSVLKQVPGPKNALGQIKFEMPNAADIYMHDTPNRGLFALARRTYSHGCVRVEDPRELAHILLASDAWSRAAIDDAIASGATSTVPLPRAVPVYLLYWTAFVDPDGTIEFRDDVYGRDRQLAAALAVQKASYHFPAAERNGCQG